MSRGHRVIGERARGSGPVTGSHDTKRRTFLRGVGALLSMALLPRRSRARQSVPPRTSAPDFGVVPVAESWARGSEDYEKKRRSMVWQDFKPARRPDLIVRAEREADVVEALRFARERNLPVAVRCGGHSYVAAFLREGGMLLDVSRLRQVDIDSDNRTVAAQPGVSAAELSALLGAENLAFPVAHAPTVTIGGYLLGGGMGWNGESWGTIACGNVQAVSMVSPAARPMTVSHRYEPDLFWAARGAGPAFCGAVTRFHLRAFPKPPVILRSTYLFPLECAPRVGRWLQQAAAAGNRDLELTMVLGSEADRGGSAPYCLASVVSFAIDPVDGEAALRSIARSAPREDAVSVAEYSAVTMAELFAGSQTGTPRRIAADNIWTARPLAAAERMVPHVAATPSAENVIIINFRDRRAVPEEMAFTVTGPAYVLWMASWSDPLEDAGNQGWVDRAAELLEPVSLGSYVNETDFIRRPERARRCFSAHAWSRLRRVRRRHDPDGRFPAPFRI